jgi:hypothetical protein
MSTEHQPDRMTGGVTNAERAEDGGDALLRFARGQYHHPSGEDITTALGDLFCSLLHFLGSMGYDSPVITMREALKEGQAHYRAETYGGEPPEDEDGREVEEPPFASDPVCDPDRWMILLGGGDDE